MAFSLVFNADIGEYYICKSTNVIMEEDKSCLVTFRAKLLITHGMKQNTFFSYRS